MVNRYEAVNNYLNRGIIEANIAYAKMHQSSFSIAKFEFVVDLEDGFFFKDLIAYIHTELGFHTLLQHTEDTFLLIFRDIKIHHAKKILKKLEHSVKQFFKVELKSIGITLFDETDSYKSLMDRLDKYFVMSRFSSRKKIFYGTLAFDFYETQNKSDVFASITRKENKVVLHNLYNGIPIKEEAAIVKYEDGVAQLQITSPKIVYYTKESFTFIQHDKIPSIIKARIIKVDPTKSLLVLAHLEFLDASPLDRAHIRVQPQKPINATLFLNKVKLIDGTLDSVSETSVVVHVKLADIEKIIHQDLVHKEFDISFQIPTDKGFLTMISAKATIFSIVNETIVVTMQPNTFMKSKLKQYVALRQSSLLVDLRQQLKHLL